MTDKNTSTSHPLIIVHIFVSPSFRFHRKLSKMSIEHFELFPWLLGTNFRDDALEGFKRQSRNKGTPTEGIGKPGKARILRYDAKAVEMHIKKWIEDKVRVRYLGINNLLTAAKHGELRKGQLIFEQVHISSADAPRLTEKCSFQEVLNPLFSKFKTNTSQLIPHFRIAVYAGIHHDIPYVVDNDGENGIGTIMAMPLDCAFKKQSTFFIVSPPHDVKGETSRYITHQRALATVGINYRYHNLATSWKQFGLLMMGFDSESKSLQQETSRMNENDTSETAQVKKTLMQQYESKGYNELHESVDEKMSSVRRGVILTLDYLMEQSLKTSKWDQNNVLKEPQRLDYINEITNSYNELMNAVGAGLEKNVIELVNLGLDLGTTTAYGKTALAIAATKGHTDVCRALITKVREQYQADLNHRDSNQHTALEYAVLYRQQDTLNFLRQLIDGEKQEPDVQER